MYMYIFEILNKLGHDYSMHVHVYAIACKQHFYPHVHAHVKSICLYHSISHIIMNHSKHLESVIVYTVHVHI